MSSGGFSTSSEICVRSGVQPPKKNAVGFTVGLNCIPPEVGTGVEFRDYIDSHQSSKKISIDSILAAGIQISWNRNTLIIGFASRKKLHKITSTKG